MTDSIKVVVLEKEFAGTSSLTQSPASTFWPEAGKCFGSFKVVHC